MRFIGSTSLDWDGKAAFKIRNRTQDFVAPCHNFLDNQGKDPRYVEFFMDFAGQVWVRRPAGTQVLLEKPYFLITRTAKGLEVKEVLDSG